MESQPDPGAEWIVKHDDDTCLEPRYLRTLLSRLHAKRMALSAAGWREFYAGSYKFRGDEYESMKGPNGTVAPSPVHGGAHLYPLGRPRAHHR